MPFLSSECVSRSTRGCGSGGKSDEPKLESVLDPPRCTIMPHRGVTFGRLMIPPLFSWLFGPCFPLSFSHLPAERRCPPSNYLRCFGVLSVSARADEGPGPPPPSFPLSTPALMQKPRWKGWGRRYCRYSHVGVRLSARREAPLNDEGRTSTDTSSRTVLMVNLRGVLITAAMFPLSIPSVSFRTSTLPDIGKLYTISFGIPYRKEKTSQYSRGLNSCFPVPSSRAPILGLSCKRRKRRSLSPHKPFNSNRVRFFS